MAASYYRAILFRNGEDVTRLPQSLMELHGWAMKSHQALGLGPLISKAVALTVAMTWMSNTEDGREFTRTNTTLGDMFAEPSGDCEAAAVASAVDWDKVALQTCVIVTLRDNSTKQGMFHGRRGAWLDVLVDGEMKPFRMARVQLAGA